MSQLSPWKVTKSNQKNLNIPKLRERKYEQLSKIYTELDHTKTSEISWHVVYYSNYILCNSLQYQLCIHHTYYASRVMQLQSIAIIIANVYL